MNVTSLSLPEVLLIEPTVFGDERGYFMESWNRQRYAGAGIDVDFVQSNVSRSAHGVLRGLHYQNPNPQGKLVYVTEGEVFDVAVDIRPQSPRFGQWAGALLSAENHRQQRHEAHGHDHAPPLRQPLEPPHDAVAQRHQRLSPAPAAATAACWRPSSRYTYARTPATPLSNRSAARPA